MRPVVLFCSLLINMGVGGALLAQSLERVPGRPPAQSNATEGSTQNAPSQAGESAVEADSERVTRPVSADWHHGSELFQMLLEESGLRITDDLDACLGDPTSSVIVLFGRIDPSLLSFRLRKFVRQGGSALLASDARCRFHGLGFIDGRLISAPAGRLRYQNQPDVLRLQQLDGTHPLMTGIHELIVNRSSWIGGLDPTLGVGRSAALVPRRVQPRESWDEAVLCTVKVPSPGRLVLAADHSLFTNGMLWHGDNALLAINVRKYLNPGGRDRLIFVRDGRPLPGYQELLSSAVDSQAGVPPEQLPEQFPELGPRQMVQVLNRTIAKAEDADLLNALLVERPRRLDSRYYFRWLLLVLAAVLLGLVLFYLLSRGPTLTGAKYPRTEQAVSERSEGLAAGLAVNGRQRGRAARLLAVDVLTRLTGTDSPELWQSRLPVLLLDRVRRLEPSDANSTWARIEESGHQVLQIAASDQNLSMSRAKLLGLHQSIAELNNLFTPVTASDRSSSPYPITPLHPAATLDRGQPS